MPADKTLSRETNVTDSLFRTVVGLVVLARSQALYELFFYPRAEN